MIRGHFVHENDLLKHHVRLYGWLPTCKRRQKALQSVNKQKEKRRLRYFTFCAVSAIDVLMLDVAKVIRPNPKDNRFDTVVFFDKEIELVVETQKRIPGAIGFPGDFVSTVLLDDPDEYLIVEGIDSLLPPSDREDDRSTRSRQQKLDIHRRFLDRFPFDVINLDLEEFMFKPNDQYPGKLLRALRKVFYWQCRPIGDSAHTGKTVSEFSLMFTTQIGPPNLSNDYLTYLRNCLKKNIADDGELTQHLLKRGGTDQVDELEQIRFDIFFKLSLPKVIASILMEQDWYVDGETGIQVFEFERPSVDGPYKMLHLVMDVKRQTPDHDQRAPGESSPQADAAHKQVVRRLFAEPETVVTEDMLDKELLQASLDKIKARRRRYYPDKELDR